MLRLEQLPDRSCPSALFDLVNDQWQSQALAGRPQASLVEDAVLDSIAAAWARDADGLGGDGRDVGPQTDSIFGWWMGAEIQTSVPQLVAGPSLIHGSSGVRAGVAQSGEFLALITGLPAISAVPPSSKGSALL